MFNVDCAWNIVVVSIPIRNKYVYIVHTYFFINLNHIFFNSESIFGRDETDRVILPCLSGRNDTSSDLKDGMYIFFYMM